MLGLADRLTLLADSLEGGGIPYAFGGAIALAYATEQPRGTRDLDVNIFLDVGHADRVLDSLPDGVRRPADKVALLRRDEQVRLMWDETPIDLFFAAAPFHHDVATRCRTVPFGGREIPVLDPGDLAVFKVMFDRSKDWTDLEAMLESGTLDIPLVTRRLAELLGDDSRIGRLRQLGR